MALNDLGMIAHDQWPKLMERFTKIELEVFQIMPNHMHGIIVINDPHVGATLAVAPVDLRDSSTSAGAHAPVDVNNNSSSAGVSPAPTAWDDHNIGAGAHAAVDMNNNSSSAGVSPAPTARDDHNIGAGAHAAVDMNNHSTRGGQAPPQPRGMIITSGRGRMPRSI